MNNNNIPQPNQQPSPSSQEEINLLDLQKKDGVTGAPQRNNEPLSPRPITFYIIGGIILLLVLVGAFFIYWRFFAPSYLVIEVQPSSSKVTIDRSKYPAGKIKIAPGNHLIQVASNGFLAYIANFTTRSLQSLNLKTNLKQLTVANTLDTSSALDLTLSVDEKYLYYLNANEKKFYRVPIGETGARPSASPKEELAPAPDFISPNDPTSLIWSNQKDKVIIKTKDQNYFYDLTTRQGKELSKNILDIGWLENDKGIIYIYNNSQNQTYTISVADPDGTNWQKFIDIDPQLTKLAVSTDYKQLVLGGEKKLFLLNLTTKELKNIVYEQDPDKILASAGASRLILINKDRSLLIYDDQKGIVDPAIKVYQKNILVPPDGSKIFWVQQEDNYYCLYQMDNNSKQQMGCLDQLFYSGPRDMYYLEKTKRILFRSFKIIYSLGL